MNLLDVILQGWAKDSTKESYKWFNLIEILTLLFDSVFLQSIYITFTYPITNYFSSEIKYINDHEPYTSILSMSMGSGS